MKHHPRVDETRASICAVLVALTIVAGACASIPKESVELNMEIGKGIAESRRSYTGVLNAYFASKKQQVDQWIENEYLPAYLANIQAALKADGQSEILTPLQMKDALRDVMVERDQKHADLENTRVFLLTRSDHHYAQLIQGNTGITRLLQSAVSVEEATSSVTTAVKSVSGGTVDLELIERTFDAYLKKAGAASAKGTSLYDTIKSTIDSKGERP